MKRATQSSVAAVLVAVFALAVPVAHAQLFYDDEARKAILQLRERMNNMQNEIDVKADKTSSLDLHNQNEALRQEIARLRGQIEVLTNELANAQKRQKDFYVDLDNRLRKLEPQKMVVDGREISVEQTEQRAYEAALAYFREGDFRNAGASFYDFTRRYPQSGLAASAQYWLGNTYYAQRDYTNAIAAQQVVLEKYPKDARAPEALLNIASSHMELKDRDAARRALETLVANYPDAPATSTARERLNALR
jgi:tol-pal system protein YbgF